MPFITQAGTFHFGSLFSALCSGFCLAFSPFFCFTTEQKGIEWTRARRVIIAAVNAPRHQPAGLTKYLE
jgi:hypothetical protein